MTCPRCGFGENPAEARFCENCGGELGAEQPSAAVAVQAASAAADQSETDAFDPFDAPTRELPSTPAPVPVADGWTCACGEQNPEAEGYCQGCGEPRPAAVAALAPGDTFAGFRIVDGNATQGFVARLLEEAEDAEAALLRFGGAAEVAETAATLSALGAAELRERLGFAPVADLLSSGTDSTFGSYTVVSRPAGDWHPFAGVHSLPAERAQALLDQLLAVVEAASRAGRALLLSPAQLAIDGERFLIDNPVAPALPLDRPLLADPTFLPPELRDGRADVGPWAAGEFCAAATLRSATGNALGFPPAWHTLMARLLAADPDQRPASLEDVCVALHAPGESARVTEHQTAFGTDVGHHHPVNQDAGGVWSWTLDGGTPLTLAVVADGVSAGTRSELAASLAVELLQQAVEAHHADAGLDSDALYGVLYQAGLEAQAQVAAMPFESYERANATTLVAVCVLGDRAVGMWCGDSRAYGATPEGCRQLSRDHSWVNLAVDSGRMTIEQAKRDPRAHVIARWLGIADPPRPDPGYERFDVELAQGDRLLVCSDGLYMYYDEAYAGEQELADVIFAHADDAQAAVDEMVKRALDRGGFDNITAALVGVR